MALPCVVSPCCTRDVRPRLGLNCGYALQEYRQAMGHYDDALAYDIGDERRRENYRQRLRDAQDEVQRHKEALELAVNATLDETRAEVRAWWWRWW